MYLKTSLTVTKTEHEDDKPPFDCLIELPRAIGGSDDQHTLIVDGLRAVELHQELRLDPPRGAVVLLAAGAEQGVDFVDEDDAGLFTFATTNRVRTIFSDSPTHLLVSELALMLKKVEFDSLAMALPIRVLPVPVLITS